MGPSLFKKVKNQKQCGLLKIVEDVRNSRKNIFLAGYNFGEGQPKLEPPEVEAFRGDGRINKPRLQAEVLQGYLPVEISFAEAIRQYLSDDFLPEKLDLTFAEVFPILRAIRGRGPPQHYDFHLDTTGKAGSAYRPISTDIGTEAYDLIKGIFEKHGWKIEIEIDTTLYGGAPKKEGMPHAPHPRYNRV